MGAAGVSLARTVSCGLSLYWSRAGGVDGPDIAEATLCVTAGDIEGAGLGELTEVSCGVVADACVTGASDCSACGVFMLLMSNGLKVVMLLLQFLLPLP